MWWLTTDKKLVITGTGYICKDERWKDIWKDDIEMIESIMHSNPRWGGRVTNRFEFHK